MSFSEKLYLLRKKKGLSQDQLAEMLDVSRQSVSKWEAQQTLPEPGKIILISNIFGVSIDRLLRDELPVEPDILICTRCGKENQADYAFCGYCGNPFTPYAAARPDSETGIKADSNYSCPGAAPQLQGQEPEEKSAQAAPAAAKPQTEATAPKFIETPASPAVFRTSMEVWMIVCMVITACYALVGISERDPGMVLGMCGSCGLLSVMFYVLARSPKENPVILNRQSGLKKSSFVLICVAVAFVILCAGVQIST